MKKKIVTMLLIAIIFMTSIVNVSAYTIEDKIISYGGNYTTAFSNVKATNDGGYVAVGYTTSTNILGIEKNGDMDAIIVKYAKDGNMEWQKNYSGNKMAYFLDVIPTNDDGYVAVGYTMSTNVKEIEQNALLVKYDKNGTIEWQKNYSGNGRDQFSGVTQTSQG